MASPPITQNTVGLIPVTNMGTPTTSPNAASWLGRPPMTTVPYPMVPGLLWQGKGQGNFSLVEAGVAGPRMSPSKGTLDAWVVAPAAGSARYFLLLGSNSTTFTGSDLGSFRFGVSTTNRLFGLVQDASGTAVVTFTDATVGALVAGRTYHLQLAWDATLGIAAAAINGTRLPGTAFSVAPSAAWNPAVPLRCNLYKGATAPAWSANIPLVQISSSYLL